MIQVSGGHGDTPLLRELVPGDLLSPCPVVSSTALHQSFQILKEKRRKGAGEEPACGHCSALAEAPRPTHKPDGCDPKVPHQEMQNLKPRRNDQSTSPAGSHGAAKRPKPPASPQPQETLPNLLPTTARGSPKGNSKSLRAPRSPYPQSPVARGRQEPQPPAPRAAQPRAQPAPFDRGGTAASSLHSFNKICASFTFIFHS